MAAEHRPYLAHLRGRDPDSLPSDVDDVRALLDSRGWRLISDLLDEVHEQAVSRLLFSHAGTEGKIMDQAEYARLLGFLSGIRQTRAAAEAFLMFAERERTKETRNE